MHEQADGDKTHRLLVGQDSCRKDRMSVMSGTWGKHGIGPAIDSLLTPNESRILGKFLLDWAEQKISVRPWWQFWKNQWCRAKLRRSKR